MSTIASATRPHVRFAALRGRVPLPWGTVAALAVLLAFANGFVIVAIQGAVGAIERAQHPFADWMVYSAILVPVFGLAVIGVLTRAHRRGRRTVRTVLLVTAATTAVGITLLITSLAYDYHLQAELLGKTASVHNHTVGGADGAQNPAYADDGWTPELRQTMLVAVKGFGLGTILLASVNAFLVAWVAALRGGRLSTSRQLASNCARVVGDGVDRSARQQVA